MDNNRSAVFEATTNFAFFCPKSATRAWGWGCLGVAFRWAEACGFAGAVGIVTLISIILIYSSFMLL